MCWIDLPTKRLLLHQNKDYAVNILYNCLQEENVVVFLTERVSLFFIFSFKKKQIIMSFDRGKWFSFERKVVGLSMSVPLQATVIDL